MAAVLQFSVKLGGVGGASGTTQNLQLVSGRVVGAGAVLFDYGLLVSGDSDGATTVYGQVVKLINITARTQGSGQFIVSVPLPIHGVGDTVGYINIVEFPFPQCTGHTEEGDDDDEEIETNPFEQSGERSRWPVERNWWHEWELQQQPPPSQPPPPPDEGDNDDDDEPGPGPKGTGGW